MVVFRIAFTIIAPVAAAPQVQRKTGLSLYFCSATALLKKLLHNFSSLLRNFYQEI